MPEGILPCKVLVSLHCIYFESQIAHREHHCSHSNAKYVSS